MPLHMHLYKKLDDDGGGGGNGDVDDDEASLYIKTSPTLHLHTLFLKASFNFLDISLEVSAAAVVVFFLLNCRNTKKNYHYLTGKGRLLVFYRIKNVKYIVSGIEITCLPQDHHVITRPLKGDP